MSGKRKQRKCWAERWAFQVRVFAVPSAWRKLPAHEQERFLHAEDEEAKLDGTFHSKVQLIPAASSRWENPCKVQELFHREVALHFEYEALRTVPMRTCKFLSHALRLLSVVFTSCAVGGLNMALSCHFHRIQPHTCREGACLCRTQPSLIFLEVIRCLAENLEATRRHKSCRPIRAMVQDYQSRSEVLRF